MTWLEETLGSVESHESPVEFFLEPFVASLGGMVDIEGTTSGCSLTKEVPVRIVGVRWLRTDEGRDIVSMKGAGLIASGEISPDRRAREAVGSGGVWITVAVDELSDRP